MVAGVVGAPLMATALPLHYLYTTSDDGVVRSPTAMA
jgi:hypothetical protein